MRCWGAWSLLGLPYGGVTACALSWGLVCNWFPQLQCAEVNYWCDNEDTEWILFLSLLSRYFKRRAQIWLEWQTTYVLFDCASVIFPVLISVLQAIPAKARQDCHWFSFNQPHRIENFQWFGGRTVTIDWGTWNMPLNIHKTDSLFFSLMYWWRSLWVWQWLQNKMYCCSLFCFKSLFFQILKHAGINYCQCFDCFSFMYLL